MTGGYRPWLTAAYCKDHPRIEAMGSVDELNSLLGV